MKKCLRSYRRSGRDSEFTYHEEPERALQGERFCEPSPGSSGKGWESWKAELESDCIALYGIQCSGV